MVEDLMEGSLQRLQAFLASEDGFALAEQDLELRGPGEIWGTAQSGFPEFKIASIKDVDILKEAREAAQAIIKNDPDLRGHLDVKQRIAKFLEMMKSG
jgi:ATP-dependent DNA helicase RecG